MSANTSKPAHPVPPKRHRLPCRGCTASCQHYTTCDGKPWRVEKARSK